MCKQEDERRDFFEMGHWKINRNSSGRKRGQGRTLQAGRRAFSWRQRPERLLRVWRSRNSVWVLEYVSEWEGEITEKQAEARGHRGQGVWNILSGNE